jgi:hypothetical protein
MTSGFPIQNMTTEPHSAIVLGTAVEDTARSVPRFYLVLGVPTDATQEVIDDTTKTLLDSIPVADVARRRDIEAAYSVLSDPLKRIIYDKMDERGLAYLEHRWALDAMDRIGLHATLLVAAVLGFISAVATLSQSVTIALKIDNKIDWGWAAVLFPTWIFLIDLWIMCAAYMLLKPKRRPKEAATLCDDTAAVEKMTSWRPFLPCAVAALIGSTITGASLGYVLDRQTSTIIPTAVFACVTEVMVAVALLPVVLVSRIHAQNEFFGLRVHPWTITALAVRRSIFLGYRFVLWILLGVKIASGTDRLPWHVVVLPIDVECIAAVVAAVLYAIVEVKNKKVTLSQNITNVFMFCIAMALILTATNLTAWKATDPEGAPPLMVCFSPLFILFGTLVLAAGMGIYWAATLTVSRPAFEIATGS